MYFNSLIFKCSDSLLLHPVSSLPSVQSTVPSQRWVERIHVPLLHRKAPLWQETVQYVTSIVVRYSRYVTWVSNCQNGWKSYCSFSHHCRPLGRVDGWARDYMFQELVIMVEKLTAVSLITSIRASPNSSASWGGGDALATGTSKLGETTLTCIDVKYSEKVCS